MAGRDLDQVQPKHVVDQPPAASDTRAHQTGQDVYGWTAARQGAFGLPRQFTEFPVAFLTEQLGEFGAAFARGQQPLYVLVVQAMQRQRRVPQLTHLSYVVLV